MPPPRSPLTRSVPAHRHPEGDPLDLVAVEEPLEIRVAGVAAAITMRTPGDDLDLALGFLTTEGVIDGPDDVRAAAAVGDNTVDVLLSEGVPALRARSADRTLYATSSCGICGIASIERLKRRAAPMTPWQPRADVLLALPERLRTLQPGFDASGGLHAAALFDPEGALSDLREDVGRHNAVDKVIGARLRRDAVDFTGLGLVVSSRAGFEIVQKCLVVGISVLAAFGAPTSLAIDTARAAGIHLVGWLRPDRFTIYSP